MTGPVQWEIPRKVWFILLSWGLSVLVLAGLFSFWLWHVQREKDQAMCAMMTLFTAGPEPAPGPAGDRGRAVLAAMRAYQSTLRCDEFR